MEGAIGGVWFRTVRGNKFPGDVRLEWRINGRYEPVSLDAIALVVDVITDNENARFPWPASGGGKVYKFLRQAMRDGWQRANYCLHLERALRDDPNAYRIDGRELAEE
jgi:hypothetical protein